MNIHWTSKKNNRLMPWYIILPRLLIAAPLIYIGVFIASLGVLAAYGWHEMKDYLEYQSVAL